MKLSFEQALAADPVTERKSDPWGEEIRKLFESTDSFGVIGLEYSWGKKLTGELDQLLGD